MKSKRRIQIRCPFILYLPINLNFRCFPNFKLLWIDWTYQDRYLNIWTGYIGMPLNCQCFFLLTTQTSSKHFYEICVRLFMVRVFYKEHFLIRINLNINHWKRIHDIEIRHNQYCQLYLTLWIDSEVFFVTNESLKICMKSKTYIYICANIIVITELTVKLISEWNFLDWLRILKLDTFRFDNLIPYLTKKTKTFLRLIHIHLCKFKFWT